MNIWAAVIIALALATVGCALVLLALVRWLGAILDGRRWIASPRCGGVILIGTGAERHHYEMARGLLDPIRSGSVVRGGLSRRANHTSTANKTLRFVFTKPSREQHFTT